MLQRKITVQNKYFRAVFAAVGPRESPGKAGHFRLRCRLLAPVGIWEKCSFDRYCSRGGPKIIFGRIWTATLQSHYSCSASNSANSGASNGAPEREQVLREIAACCVAAMAVAGCASTPPANRAPALPLNVDNGIGSQFGNYEMHPAGETQDAKGNRCVIFNWDRPLNRDFAIRYSSESCESKEHPVWMSATTYTRAVIPISQSDLGTGHDKAQPDENK
jgi:hypothetical protein